MQPKNILLIIVVMASALVFCDVSSVHGQMVVSGPTTVCLTGTATYRVIGASGYTCGITKTYNWQRYPVYGTVVSGGGPNDDYITLSFSQSFTNMSVWCSLMCSTTSLASSTVQNIKTGSVATPTVVNRSRCGPGTVTLSATPGSGASSVRWYQAATGGTSLGSGSTFTTPSISANTTYYVASYSDVVSCLESSRVAVTASVFYVDPPTVNNVTICSPQAVALTGTVGTGGNILRWYDVATGGTHLAQATSFTTPTINATTSYYVSTFNSYTGCESTRRQVTITTKILNAPAGADVSRCATGTLTLVVTPDVAATTTKWYAAATGGTALFTGNSYVTPSLGTSTPYYASSFDAVSGCESALRKTVMANVVAFPTAPTTVTGDRRFAAGTLVLTVLGTPPTGGAFRWYDNGVLAGTGSTYITPSVSASSSTRFSVKAATYNGCESSGKIVPVYIESLPVIVASSDRVVKQGSVTLSVSGTYATYSWKNGAGYEVGTGPTYTTNSPGRFYVTVTKIGVSGSGTSLPYDLKGQFTDVNGNYIITNTFLEPGVTDPMNTSIDASMETTVYYDGLGRPIQRVTTQGSPQKKDIVVPIVYDALGRQSVQYLPYVSAENNGLFKPTPTGTNTYGGSAHYTFYNNASNDKIVNDKRPYSEVVFEASPLERPEKIYGPGEAWGPIGANKFLVQKFAVNLHGDVPGQEMIIAWELSSAGQLVRSPALLNVVEPGGYYSTGQLSIKTLVDENGNEQREYINKTGQIILKKVHVKGHKSDFQVPGNWAETYFIYDDFGNLAIVLPPEAVQAILTGN